jgi:hypothetical protein
MTLSIDADLCLYWSLRYAECHSPELYNVIYQYAEFHFCSLTNFLIVMLCSYSEYRLG